MKLSRYPLAFGFGFGHRSKAGNILDTWYPQPMWLQLPDEAEHEVCEKLAADIEFVVAVARFFEHAYGTATYQLEHASDCYKLSGRMKDTPFADHEQLKLLLQLGRLDQRGVIVATFIDQPSHDEGAQSVPDAYLRLHLRQLGKTVGNKGVNDTLPMNYWTDEGPVAPEDLDFRRMKALEAGRHMFVGERNRYPLWGNYYVCNQKVTTDGNIGMRRML